MEPIAVPVFPEVPLLFGLADGLQPRTASAGHDWRCGHIGAGDCGLERTPESRAFGRSPMGAAGPYRWSLENLSVLLAPQGWDVAKLPCEFAQAEWQPPP